MKIRVLCLLFALAACSCRQSSNSYASYDGFALGTTYSIVVNTADTVGLHGEIITLFEEVENSMSIFRAESLLSRINRNETDSVDHYIAYCIALARELSTISNGMYDITVKPLTQAWGFAGAAMNEIPNTTHILQYVGYDKIKIEDGKIIKSDPRVEIDLNSIAKGYTSDLVAGLLDKRGVDDYLIEVGGEIYCKGRNRKGAEWMVGIDSPVNNNFTPGESLQATINISDKGIATSGNYRRHHTNDDGRKVVHTINPLTGSPQESDILSATVVADNCALADGFATMLMVAGLEKSKEILACQPQIMAYLIFDKGDGTFDTYSTSGLESRIIPVASF